MLSTNSCEQRQLGRWNKDPTFCLFPESVPWAILKLVLPISQWTTMGSRVPCNSGSHPGRLRRKRMGISRGLVREGWSLS
uniref:Uncharacterized protein n=1 Tax=Anguilla anguilla TaxID=7936 RepID=A0A0E9VZD3_ANGAN